MNYGEIKKTDIANGVGVRVSLFVSGCRHHCQNCFNEDTWDFNFGKPFNESAQKEVIDALSKPFIAGLTLIGGEPFEAENQKPLLDFVKKVRSIYENKNIWCYSGFTFDEIMGKSRASGPTAKELISYIDVLVDGRFVENLKDISLKFRGSSNQRIIDIKETLKQGKIVELKL